ncbi:MAG: hypothetical protein ABEJ22_01320 [Haloferacaceae archaeon]
MRGTAAAVGVATVVTGVYSVYVGPAGPFDFDYTFVTLVGVLALVQGLRYGLGRRHTEFRAAETDDPELRYHVPVPGDDHDERFAVAGGWGYRARNRQRSVREDLHRVAVETVTIRENCAPEEAEARVAAGTWTADPVAAAFLGDDVPAPPLRDRLLAALSRDSSFVYRARRTVAAVAALQRPDGGAPGDGAAVDGMDAPDGGDAADGWRAVVGGWFR